MMKMYQSLLLFVCGCAFLGGVHLVQADSYLYPQGVALSDGGNYAVSVVSNGGVRSNGTSQYVSPGVWIIHKNESGLWDETPQQLISDNGTEFSQFSYSADFSHKATYLVVGTYHLTYGRKEGGNLRIFSRMQNKWTLLQIISDSDSPGWSFGASVAISDCGTYIIANVENFQAGFGYGGGYVFTYKKSGDQWLCLGSGIDSGKKNGFGSSLAIGQDGTYVYALIGAPWNMSAVKSVVYEYVLEREATWALKTIHDPSSMNNPSGFISAFGSAISISGNNEYILVGAPRANNIGTSLLYNRHWEQQAELTFEKSWTESYFGAAVSLSFDGSVAAVGSPTTYDGGHVHMFHRVNATYYNHTQVLSLPHSERFNNFGCNVQLSGDGKDLIATVGTMVLNQFYGQTFFYQFIKGSWTLVYTFDGCDVC